MKMAPSSPSPAKVGRKWQKTQYANLIRYVPFGTYYARLRVGGKLIWRSLQTDVLSVAKLRLSDFEKQERQRGESAAAVHAGRITVADAIALHPQRVGADDFAALGEARRGGHFRPFFDILHFVEPGRLGRLAEMDYKTLAAQSKEGAAVDPVFGPLTGSKFEMAKNSGPQGAPNATHGSYQGTVNFYFGKLP